METIIAVASFVGLIVAWSILPLKVSVERKIKSLPEPLEPKMSESVGLLIQASSATAQS